VTFQSRYGVAINITIWAFLFALYLIIPTLARTLGTIIAGVLLGLGFTWISWMNSRPHVHQPLVWLKLWTARQAGLANAALGASVFLTAGILGGGSVFGLELAQGPFAPLAYMVAGIGVGFFMYIGQEMDDGFREMDQRFASISFVFTAMIWALMWVIATAAGGALLIGTMLITRVSASLLIYRRWTGTALVERLTTDLVVAFVMLVPVIGLLFRLS
jgi:hypothetical protein